jgi:hypothetical protein
MVYRIKGWSKFQHFKDRRPPWVKLYRDILEDPDWHELDGDAAKALVALWLIASEDDEQEGKLPELRKLAFRLRISESKTIQTLTKLKHWLIHDDIDLISARYQDDAPETETETETETEGETYSRASVTILFEEFWQAYPRKISKVAAAKAYAKAIGKASPEHLLNAVDGWKKSKVFSTDEQYIPHPATWLNAERWNDQHELTLDQTDRVMSDEERERTKQEAQQWMLDFRKKQQLNQS